MRQTQNLLNEQIRQAEATLAHLRRVNRLLEQFEILEHGQKN
jgi:hypothetical protein